MVESSTLQNFDSILGSVYRHLLGKCSPILNFKYSRNLRYIHPQKLDVQVGPLHLHWLIESIAFF